MQNVLQLDDDVDNKPTVYVLWDGIKSYYVGSTLSYRRRLWQHTSNSCAAKVTKAWKLSGRMPQEYWRINLDTKPSQSKLVKFENLVRERLTVLNPECIIY